MDTTEEWRPIPGYSDYEVSSLGRVRSWIAHMGRPLPHIIKPGLSTSGYRQFSIRIPGNESTRRTVAVHRVVAEVFLGPRPGHPRKVHVCHNDSDKENNAASNLRYDTVLANTQDAIDQGTHPSQRMSDKTHCPVGHEYTPENTYWNRNRNNKTPSRYCRTCKLARDAERYRSTKAA